MLPLVDMVTRAGGTALLEGEDCHMLPHTVFFYCAVAPGVSMTSDRSCYEPFTLPSLKAQLNIFLGCTFLLVSLFVKHSPNCVKLTQ